MLSLNAATGSRGVDAVLCIAAGCAKTHDARLLLVHLEVKAHNS